MRNYYNYKEPLVDYKESIYLLVDQNSKRKVRKMRQIDSK